MFEIKAPLTYYMGFSCDSSPKLLKISIKILFFWKKWDYADVDCHVFYAEDDSMCHVLNNSECYFHLCQYKINS